MGVSKVYSRLVSGAGVDEEGTCDEDGIVDESEREQENGSQDGDRDDEAMQRCISLKLSREGWSTALDDTDRALAASPTWTRNSGILRKFCP